MIVCEFLGTKSLYAPPPNPQGKKSKNALGSAIWEEKSQLRRYLRKNDLQAYLWRFLSLIGEDPDHCGHPAPDAEFSKKAG